MKQSMPLCSIMRSRQSNECPCLCTHRAHDASIIALTGMPDPTSSADVLATDRLLLRPWRAADREGFAAMSADSRVARYLPSTYTRQQSDAVVDRIEAHFAAHGFGWWAVEIPGVCDFAGFIGLSIPRFEAHFTPCVEIGWRLAAEHWGNGYATEGARAALRYGFEMLKLDEIVSFTVPQNLPSRRVMEKIGMQHDPGDDFDHPNLPDDSPLLRHVLYRKRAVDR